uniref:Fe2OG dioxygenase domain-containing protein n=1 Tax=Ciona savignyi TaxID=51511 RepID=H2YQW2_CIOSA
MNHIPIVDFKDCYDETLVGYRSNIEATGKLLLDALSTVGFVYLKNTPIKSDEIAAVNKVTEEIFHASSSEKNKFEWDAKRNFGYVSLTRENVDPKKTDYKEAFNLGAEALDGDMSLSWPHHLSSDFYKVMIDFSQTCKQLSHQVLRVLAIGMGLKDEDFFIKCHSKMHTGQNYTTLRSLYYPPVPKDLPVNQTRLGVHSDYGSLTLLFQDDVGGLQVENTQNEFVDAVPIEGTVVVNIGDALESWTLGKLKSTKHKVIIPDDPSVRETVRRSLVYFVHPDHDTVINKPLVYANGDNAIEIKKTQKPITAFEHTRRKLDASYTY